MHNLLKFKEILAGTYNISIHFRSRAETNRPKLNRQFLVEISVGSLDWTGNIMTVERLLSLPVYAKLTNFEIIF